VTYFTIDTLVNGGSLSIILFYLEIPTSLSRQRIH